MSDSRKGPSVNDTRPVEGYLDGVVGFDIAGWAWRPGDDEPVEVQLTAAGRVLASTQAQRARADLADAGKRGGRCAFRFSIGRLGLNGQATTLAVLAGGQPIGDPINLSASFVVAAEIYASRIPAAGDATTDPDTISTQDLTVLPLRLGGPAGVEGWIDRFDSNGVSGWAYDPRAPGTTLSLAIVHHGETVGTLSASVWREDLAEHRQGDGRAGISGQAPVRWMDGQARTFDLRIAPDGPSVLDAPITLALKPSMDTAASSPLRRPLEAPQRRKRILPRAMQLSVIVLFYNMRREAERTLTALSRAYQIGIEDLEYEVICIDNGSKEPLHAEWIESFGPEFRLVRPSRLSPSPCFAMNEAASSARGKYLALMIDGAHIVSPGALREAMAVYREDPEAVVGLRQWFFGGDQRWFSSVGYTRDMEDIAFARIGWPSDGYRLFEVSSPMMPTPNPWFDSVSESNCLFLAADVFRRIGGYDEAFSLPGGSVSNLDLFSRAVDAVGGRATMLVGEASFHQFHGGTTTNIDEDAKNSEVRGYMNAFHQMRGARLKHLDAARIRFRGHMPTPEASVTRQRPVVRAFLGVTDRIRPTDPYLYFDGGAADYLAGYAIEARLPEQTRWRGLPTGVLAGDLVSIQEIIDAVRPSRILAVNPEPGMTCFLTSMLDMFELDESKVVQVSIGDRHALHGERVEHVAATVPTHAGDVERAVRAAIGLSEDVLVIYRPDPSDNVPTVAMQAWMRFVSPLSYMVVTGTATGQPWLGYSTRWWRKAVQAVAGPGSEFSVDHSWERHLVTACPWGYLRRTGGRQDQDDGVYDAALDDLSGL